MGHISTTTVDSFKFLWQQIEQETRNLLTDTRDVLAVVGALYVCRKVFTVTANIAEAVHVHLLGQGRVDWGDTYGPWAGK